MFIKTSFLAFFFLWACTAVPVNKGPKKSKLKQSGIEAHTDQVSVKFMGRSGGLKLYGLDDRFIMVHQEKLQELDSAGNKVGGGWNTAGGSWSPVEMSTVNGTTTYNATFTKEAKGVFFQLSAWLSQGDVQVFDEMVNATVNLTANQAKFSIKVEGWEFQDPSNQLQYSLYVKDKYTENDVVVSNETTESGLVEERFSLLDGSIQFPLEATADGVVVNASVVPSSNSSSGKTYLTLTFPSFTESLVYDPNLEVHPHDRFPQDDQNPLVNNAPVACGATAAVAAALASFMI